MRHHCQHSASESVLQCGTCLDVSANGKSLGPGVAEARIVTLALPGEAEAHRLLRRALRESEAAARRFGWRISRICELPSCDGDVGYTGKDGTIFVKVRDPAASEGSRAACFYSYSFVLATLLHELVHLSHLGHGKNFYRCLSAALAACGAESWVRREARTHVCAELINAICDNDARRARALLAIMPEAASCRRPGVQLPLEYAAHHGRVALTRLLLEARADPTPCDSLCSKPGSMAPLARAAVNGNAKTAALLLAARANVGEVQEPKGQSVLSKAIAAAEAGGFAGKDGDWWQLTKVLGGEHGDRAAACELRTSLAKDDTGHCEDRARGHVRNHRKRRQRCSELASETEPLCSHVGPTRHIRRVSSMPSLPALQKIEVRQAIPLSCLSGSLAL
mmetsp:Transcript_65223/g.103348  ORF Transcript_65223/g.103348 Transcript_65223/m.103348 type:complete len:394 (+) Transcript_65223:187-1368(+)